MLNVSLHLQQQSNRLIESWPGNFSGIWRTHFFLSRPLPQGHSFLAVLSTVSRLGRRLCPFQPELGWDARPVNSAGPWGKSPINIKRKKTTQGQGGRGEAQQGGRGWGRGEGQRGEKEKKNERRRGPQRGPGNRASPQNEKDGGKGDGGAGTQTEAGDKGQKGGGEGRGGGGWGGGTVGGAGNDHSDTC